MTVLLTRTTGSAAMTMVPTARAGLVDSVRDLGGDHRRCHLSVGEVQTGMLCALAVVATATTAKGVGQRLQALNSPRSLGYQSALDGSHILAGCGAA